METPIGVIVGRFHIPQPHTGHRALIRHVQNLHQEVLIVLGESATMPTDHDPLPFPVRRGMLEKLFPGVTVRPLRDVRDDTAWSDLLDALIEATFPGRRAVLYGSRDSFIGSYAGRYETVLVPETSRQSGSAVRERIRDKFDFGAAFRKGIIYALMNRPPITYPTVDVAIVNYDTDEILLGRKSHDPPGTYRFIGGFVDPTDRSYEAAGHREKDEEAGDLGLGPFEYVCSHRVDDWRYRGTKDGIMTILFRAAHLWGQPVAKDDISEVRWFPRHVLLDYLVPEHLPLGEKLLASLAPTVSAHLHPETA